MKSERRDPKLEDAVRSALHAARAPSPEESNAVKIALYRREAEARKGRTLSLWYLPMAGNALLFALLAAAALLGISDPLLVRLAICIAGAAGIALLALQAALLWAVSDGWSGIRASLPLLGAGALLSALACAALFAAWVRADCRRRGEDEVLWPLVVVLTTPLIGLLVYLLRRAEVRRPCPACGHKVGLRAKYCEECGAHIEQQEELSMTPSAVHHGKLLIAGCVSFALLVACLGAGIASVAAGTSVNTDVTSPEQVWNLGVIQMDRSTVLGGVWRLEFARASEGFVAGEKLALSDPPAQQLHAQIACGSAPEGTSLVLWLVQGDVVQSVDVTHLEEELVLPLDAFQAGEIWVRLQINGVQNCASEIYIR